MNTIGTVVASPNKVTKSKNSKVLVSRRVIIASAVFIVGFQFCLLLFWHQRTIQDTGSHQKALTEFERLPTPINGQTHNRLSGSKPLHVNKKNNQRPFVFGIGPGTTGTHTHFNAACRAGFPSVHHASFCVSRHVGAKGVPNEVMAGLQAHLNIMELNVLAYDCARSTSSKEGSKYLKWRDTHGCKRDILEWESETKGNITTLLSSGIVGLFDYPYPNMADYILETLPKVRGDGFEPTLVMTKRDPWEWAKSRLKHGFLLCREDYNDLKNDEVDDRKGNTQLDSSSYPKYLTEFHMFECINRAVQNHTTFQARHKVHLPHLTLSDVFRYAGMPRQVYKENKDNIHQQKSQLFMALKSSMEWHQHKYFNMAKYTPDFFGENNSEEEMKNVKHLHDNGNKEKQRMSNEEVAGQLVSVLKAQGFSQPNDRLDPKDSLLCVGMVRFFNGTENCYNVGYGGKNSKCLKMDGSGKIIRKKEHEERELYVPTGEKECNN